MKVAESSGCKNRKNCLNLMKKKRGTMNTKSMSKNFETISRMKIIPF